MVFQTDRLGRWRFLNPAWEQLTGYAVASSLGRSFLKFVHPEDRGEKLEPFRPLLEGKEAFSKHELRYLTREGESRWVEVHAALLREDSEDPAGVVGTLKDISHRKSATDALLRQKERAQTTLSAIGDGVITTDPHGRIDFLNPAASRLTGWTPEQAVGRLLGEVFQIQNEPLSTEQRPGTAPHPPDFDDSDHTSSWLLRADGSTMGVEWTSTPATHAEEGLFGKVLIFRDVTLQRTFQQQMTYQATHDNLTGLVNRSALQEALDREYARAAREGPPLTILLLDLDHFKIINDYYGHTVGDQVLSRIAERIDGHFRRGDWFGRWGGEEFLCILPNTPPETAHGIAERVRADIEAQVLEIEGLPLSVTASFGAASYPECAKDSQQLLQVADSRLYEAKRSGRNRVVDHRHGDPGILSMAGKLQQALAAGGVAAAYQPIVDLSNCEVVAEEALARLFPEEGCLSAGMFIEAASDLHLVHRIDEQMIQETMQRCAGMLQEGNRMDHFVNISTELLRHRDRVDALLSSAFQICETCGPLMGSEKPLVIEITEREFLADPAEARKVLAPFIDYGFRIAVDDFGSGYSSFRYLADLPVSFLKIEGDLVARATTEPRVRAILRGIQDIARDLDLTTIAEKVEDQETADFLRGIGVDWAQGFFFGYPRLAQG